MSEPTTKEMLEVLDFFETEEWHISPGFKLAMAAIRRLIEEYGKGTAGRPLTGYIGDHFKKVMEESDKGPEVDEGFVQRFVQELCDWAGEERGSWQDAENIVFANLREAGVKVKEEK